MSEHETNVTENINAVGSGQKNKLVGVSGFFLCVLHFLFVKNIRKKLFSLFLAFMVLAYAYINVSAYRATTKKAKINNVNVELTLVNSDKYFLKKSTLKKTILGLVPEKTDLDSPYLNPQHYVIKKTVGDTDIERGYVELNKEDIYFVVNDIPIGNQDEDENFSFVPAFFWENGKSETSIKIPLDRELLADQKLNVEVELNKDGFSSNFLVLYAGVENPITVKAPMKIIHDIRLKTPRISLENRVESFYEDTEFHVYIGGVMSDNQFFFDSKNNVLIWNIERGANDDFDKRKVKVKISLDRFMQLEQEYPIEKFMVTNLEQLRTVDMAKMKEQTIRIKLRVNSSDIDSIVSDKFFIAYNLTQVSDNALIGRNGYSCEVVCKINNNELKATILDYFPKKVDVIFMDKSVETVSATSEAAKESEKTTGQKESAWPSIFK